MKALLGNEWNASVLTLFVFFYLSSTFRLQFCFNWIKVAEIFVINWGKAFFGGLFLGIIIMYYFSCSLESCVWFVDSILITSWC